MYRTPHDQRDDMKLWLSAAEVDDFLGLVKDTDHRIAFGLGLRCGLRSGEIVAATPADVANGAAGTMLRVREDTAKATSTVRRPSPPDLATTSRTVDEEAGASQVGS